MENALILVFTTILFILATVYLGWYGHRHTKNNEEFMLGRNKARPVIIALSYGATFLSTSAIVGFGGAAAMYGLSMIWLMVLCILIGTIVAFMVFGKKVRRKGQEHGARTFPEILGKTYGSPFIRTFSALIILVGMPIYCAAVLTGGVNFIAVTIGVNRDVVLLGLSLIVALYVIYGGVIAVMYNDALQAAIMFIGMAVIMIFTFWKLGGVGEAFASLQNLWANDISSTGAYDKLVAGGFNGWSESPSFGSNIWLNVVTTLLLGVGIGALAQPQLVVRFLSAKDDRALDRSMWIGAAFVLVILGAAFTMGPLSNVYFHNYSIGANLGKTAINFPNTDMIIPEFVNDLFGGMAGGDLFISLFVLALICAAISTMSALFHVMGSAAGYDIWTRRKNLREVASKTNMAGSMKANRAGTMIMVLVVVIVAYLMPGNIIAKATVIFMGMTAATLLPTMAYGLFSKGKPNITVAKISIAVGMISWSLWAFFVNKGIADVVRTPRLVGESWMIYVDPIVIGLPLSAMALVIAYLVLVRGRKEAAPEPQPQ